MAKYANITGWCGGGYCSTCERCKGCWTHGWCWVTSVRRFFFGRRFEKPKPDTINPKYVGTGK